jgi:hypothetical protein
MDQAYVNDESAASDQPIRCQLVPVPPSTDNPLSIDNPYSKDQAPPPTLTLDLRVVDAIGVIDPTTNAVITSAGLARVTATPEIYAHPDSDQGGGYQEPILVLEVPGMQTLRIGQRPIRFSVWNGEQFRYAWRAVTDITRG